MLYFLATLVARLKVDDTQLGPWPAYFRLCLARLLLNVTYQATR
ncbi:hypothetical protein [Streptomyces sp. NPDC047706]